MKQTDNLKKQVDDETDIDTKRSIIENAGMRLTDDELDMVAGGADERGGLTGDKLGPCPPKRKYSY